jgi:hypothetical protein
MAEESGTTIPIFTQEPVFLEKRGPEKQTKVGVVALTTSGQLHLIWKHEEGPLQHISTVLTVPGMVLQSAKIVLLPENLIRIYWSTNAMQIAVNDVLADFTTFQTQSSIPSLDFEALFGKDHRICKWDVVQRVSRESFQDIRIIALITSPEKHVKNLVSLSLDASQATGVWSNATISSYRLYSL